MPIYAYRCSACGHDVEVLQKLADAPLTECPNCHRATLVKQVTAAGFQLKGSGWYVTDFRDGGAKKDAKAGAKSAADEPAKADGASTAKSDAPAPAASSDGGSTKDSAASPAPAPAAPPPASTS